MNTSIRTQAASLVILAALCGCGTVQPVTGAIGRIILPSQPPAAPASPSLDAYKTEVALHVMRQNAGQTFSGRLPAMLPAIVVLNITVDEEGRMTEVAVQRARDPDAARVALASMRRSGRLPKPSPLLAQYEGLTFSETFLFDSQYRFQLRSLAGPQ